MFSTNTESSAPVVGHAVRQTSQACALLKALANERRLLILCALVDEEKSVGAIADSLDLGQAIISQQLAVLRKEGLVIPRRDAQNIFYSLAGGPVEEIIRVLHMHYGVLQEA